jgi:hypothetical protein
MNPAFEVCASLDASLDGHTLGKKLITRPGVRDQETRYLEGKPSFNGWLDWLEGRSSYLQIPSGSKLLTLFK